MRQPLPIPPKVDAQRPVVVVGGLVEHHHQHHHVDHPFDSPCCEEGETVPCHSWALGHNVAVEGGHPQQCDGVHGERLEGEGDEVQEKDASGGAFASFEDGGFPN